MIINVWEDLEKDNRNTQVFIFTWMNESERFLKGPVYKGS